MTSFGTKLRENEIIAALTDKLHNGTATYADAYEYALEVGTDLSDVFAEELTSDVLPDGKMYFNIANRVVRDPLTRAYNLIADECEGVQTQLNTAAGIALKAQRPSLPENRIKGFIDRISSEPDYDKVSWILKEPVKTYSQNVVDDSVKKNADFHYKAGLSPRIIRSAAAHCCEWCNDVAGTYPYPNVPKDIYRRHNFCRCQVEYDPRNGKRQDVHTRRWSDEKRYVKHWDTENEMFRRKDTTHRYLRDDGYEVIQKPLYNRLVREARRKGADIRVATGKVLERLNAENASAVTYGDVIFFTDNPTVSDVLEEIHHFYQNKNGLNNDKPHQQRIILNEIDAKLHLISVEKKYKIPVKEMDLTRKQLNSLFEMMTSMKAQGDWI